MHFTIDHHNYDWCYDLTVAESGAGEVVFSASCGEPTDPTETEIAVSPEQARAFAKAIMMIADEVERKAFEEMEDD